MDIFIIACVVSCLPYDIRTSVDTTVASISCLNGTEITIGFTGTRATGDRKLQYVDIQSGSVGYSLYEKLLIKQ